MIKTYPKVSIITPSYNQAKYLERTMLSVLEQDYLNLEYIVIDGGSTDSSEELIRKYSDKVAYWVSEKDKGQTDAINKGFAQATGDILAWLNSDDTYEPGAISKAVALLQENPEVGLLYGDCNFIDEHDKDIGRFPAALTNFRKLREGYVHIPQQAAFWRADLWKQVGPLDPSFYFAMDYDLWVRLAEVSELKYVQDVWANFRLHGDSKTILDDDRCWPEMIRVHKRYGGGLFSVIMVKYYLRKLLAPLVTLVRRNRVKIALDQ